MRWRKNQAVYGAGSWQSNNSCSGRTGVPAAQTSRKKGWVMSEPRISIVIPAYNVAHYVDAAVQSVLRQTVAPYEILLFNDGSTDETAEILAKYSDHELVRYFSQTNMGLGATRNLGAERARGDYLYFFDADDLLDVRFIERIQQLILHNQMPDLMMFSGEGFTERADFGSFVKQNRRWYEASGITGVQAISLIGQTGWIYPSASLYVSRTKFWRNNGFVFPSTFNEDADIIVALLASALDVVITDEILFYRRAREDSITTQVNDHRHVVAFQSNLGQAIRDISLVPVSAKKARKLLRKRCRIVATQYLEITREVGSPVAKFLLFRAAAKTGNINLFRKAFLDK